MTCIFNADGNKCQDPVLYGSSLCRKHDEFVVDQRIKFVKYIKNLEVQVDSLKSQVINLQRKNLDVNELEIQVIRLKDIIEKMNQNNIVTNEKIKQIFEKSRQELIDHFTVEINKLKNVIKDKNKIISSLKQ